MAKDNLAILNNFDINSLPDLDTVVLGALERLADEDLPAIDISNYKRPLVVGSGNADATGRVIFGDSDAIFASESTFADKLAHIDGIDEVIIVSASGAKHAPIIARAARDAGKHATLITCTSNSPARQALAAGELVDHVYPKNREPYTYNTSTYMSMLLGYTREDAGAIQQFISDKIDTLALPDFSKFDKYYLLVPTEFAGIITFLQIKFIELFGRNVARDVGTTESILHANTVAPSDELFIAFGSPNDTWGKPENRLNVPLPASADYGAMMAVGYYVIAQIQKARPPYFKDNIASYCQFISSKFGENIEPIVPGS